MNDLILKYSLLDDFRKQEVQDFIDFLLNKQEKKEKVEKPPKSDESKKETYRERIMKIPVWSEEEVAVFDENRKLFNKWTVEEW
jgi:AAA+ ATPase superfamily predicted ATPase